MKKFKEITRSDIRYITSMVDVQMKRARSYMKKRLTGMKFPDHQLELDYKILTADEYLVMWVKGAVYGTNNNSTETDVMKHIFVKDIPNRITLPSGGEVHVYIPRVIDPFYNEDLVTLLDNSYDVYIPTSSRHGLNIFDQRDRECRNILMYMKKNMTWWLRDDDGPELIGGTESDCSLYEYVLSITHYI